MISKTDVERFKSKLIFIPFDSCWYLDSYQNQQGYPHIRFNGRDQRANRVSYKIYHGSIKPGMHICHSCDNPQCVNPDHLWMGTPTDNMRDAHRKGRMDNSGFRKGNKLGKRNRMFTEDEVKEIRSKLKYRTGSIKQLAKELGINHSTLKAINNRQNYA